jgi:hypothetical protein
MFQAVPPPIIRSTKLYKQRQVLSTNTAACCYRGWAGTLVFVQFCAPDGGRRNRLKHVEQFIGINRSRKGCVLLVVLLRNTCDVRIYERQTGIVWTSLCKSTQYQISWKCVKWEPRCYMLTDGHTTDVHETDRLFARLREHAWSEPQIYAQHIVPQSYDIRNNIKTK